MKNLVMLGPESTGNRWISKTFRLHPRLRVFSRSYPTMRLEPRKYMPIKDFIKFKPGKNDWLLILTRDHTIVDLSVKKAGHNNGQPPGKFTAEKTMAALKKEMCNWPGNMTFFSYETLMMWQSEYLEHILTLIGVDPELFPFDKVKYVDGNLKYIKETLC